MAYSDGSSKPNPGSSGCGVAFFSSDEWNQEEFLCGAYLALGIANSKYAEYFGIVIA